jgi:hypothetical protein
MTFEPLVWINATFVSITPDNGHGIVTFLQHVSRVDILWHFVYLQDLSPIYLVDTGGAHALNSQLKRVYCLHASVAKVNDYFGAGRIVVDLDLYLVLQLADFFSQSLCNIGVGLNNRDGIREREDKRGTTIAHLCDLFLDGHLEGALNAVVCLYLGRVSFAEDSVLLVTLCALVIAHVLNERDSWYLEAIEHLDSLDHVDVAQSLRSCDDDSGREAQLLAQRELDVTCSWREVDDKVVQIAPVGLTYQLSHDLRNHWSSHDRSSTTTRKSIAHALDP